MTVKWGRGRAIVIRLKVLGPATGLGMVGLETLETNKDCYFDRTL